MWRYYNPNPDKANVGDCVIRAITKATGRDWQEVYAGLSACGFNLSDMPSADYVWSEYLRKKGFRRHPLGFECSVEQFCQRHPKGTYILKVKDHVVCVKDGYYCDTWNSGAEIVKYYFRKGVF